MRSSVVCAARWWITLIQEHIRFCSRNPVQSKDCFHKEVVQDQVVMRD
jgi:hypothetical protein